MVLGANTDSVPTHHAWAQHLGGVNFPLLADYDKALSKTYGVLADEAGGIALRGVFIIDPEGNLQYQLIQNLSVGRNVKEFVRVLKALQTGKACPANWEEGMSTLT
ncbi:MAG: alkyl hydroperoxide reductase/Thiol specific antioxidant/Mal allergen [Anaerosolibacter sp.]|nr:alkyl hydroperoxide reductase/Thiol specific antioxidant/Mal allergen [Anaerosolibacter sp.]